MYKVTNITKKEGHFTGEFKNGWHIILSDNYFLGPSKYAILESVNHGILDLERMGLLKVEDIGTKMPAAEPVVAPAVVKKVQSVENDAIDEAAYPDGEPNFVVKAPSQNVESEDAPAVTVASLKAKSRAK